MTDINGKMQFFNKTLSQDLGIAESKSLYFEQDHKFFVERDRANTYELDNNCCTSDLPCNCE